jgi:branched-chain amino acid transport system substrate-binding protein
MKGTRRIIIALVALALMFFFTAGSADAEYRIANITTETGPYASIGLSNTEGVNILCNLINRQGGINGEKIVLIKDDHEGDAGKALVLAKRMVYEEKVIAIIGATNTAGSMAVSRIANQAKIPQVQNAPRPADAPVVPYTFQTCPSNYTDAEALAHFALDKLKCKKLAIMHDTNAYGTTGAEATKTVLEKMGYPPVAIEKYSRDDREMTAPLLKIKNLDADGLLVWGTVNVPPLIAKEMNKLKIDIPYIGSIGVLNEKFMELAGDAANGCYFTSVLNYGNPLPGERVFFEEYKKIGKTPDLFAALGWDCLLLIAEGIKRANSKDPVAIRDGIEGLKNFEGVTGTFNMSQTDHTGTSYKDISIVKVIDGKWTSIKK